MLELLQNTNTSAKCLLHERGPLRNLPILVLVKSKGFFEPSRECGIRANEPYQKNMPSILKMQFTKMCTLL